MTAQLITDAAPDTEDWHEARTTGIGASEISAVVGLNPWESPYSLWLRKKGLIPGPDLSSAMEWGHLLEPVVAGKFEANHTEFMVSTIGTHRHADRPWQLANLDRALIAHNSPSALVPLEIKTTRYGDGYGRTGSDEIPLHVRCQVTQQMDVFGASFAWVAVLIGGSDYREYRIGFDEADAASLRDAGAAFWASIAADDLPPVDASDATYRAVRELHPDINGDDIELPVDLFDAYFATKDSADEATLTHRRTKSALLEAMGSARRATANGVPLLRRQPGRGGNVALYPVTLKESK